MLNLKRILLFGFLLSGFAALVYEVVWTQLLTLSFGASAYSFSLMLAAFFTGLGLGGYTAGKYIDGKKNAVEVFAYLEIGIGLSGLIILLFFEKVGTPLSVLYRMSGSFYLFMASVFFLSFLLMLAPSAMMGATLPVISRIYADKKDSVGRDIGSVYSFNTFGAIFGSFAAGFILIPTIGLARTTIIASVINISAAFIVFSFSRRANSFRFYAILLASMLMVLYMSSFTVQPIVTDVYSIARAEELGTDQGFAREIIYHGINAYGTVAVTDKGSYRSLWINNKVDASTFPQDMKTQLLLGYLPMFANPEAKKVLNIGLGGGFTLGAIEAFNASYIDVIELNPLVVEAAGKHFRESNGNALEDGRVNLIIADARNYLLTSDEKYDVIISEPSNLWVSGESGLFTKEHYLIVKEHLNENGVFSQWFPLYDFDESDTKVFLNTIKEVFPQVTLWVSGSDGIVIASRGPAALNYEHIIKMLNQSREVLRENYPPDELAKSFVLSDEDIDIYSAKATFHTDDHPVLEFSAAKNLLFLKNKSRSIESITDYVNKNKVFNSTSN